MAVQEHTSPAVPVFAGAAAMPGSRTGTVRTNDGVTLSYIEAGQGKPIVMIPGWSQSVAEYRNQMELADRYRVVALDIRGHGESGKPAYGYRMHRLAKDLHDFLVAKDLDGVTLMGHSMGASIMWAYWDLFRGERIAKLVIVDQVAACTGNPRWSERERTLAGSLFGADGMYVMANEVAGSAGEQAVARSLSDTFVTRFHQEDLDWLARENLKLPREYAARLLINHCMTDWRDLFATIDVPTLIVGGRASLFKVEALEWIQSQIPGSTLVVFEAEEGGSHFMFMENPSKFNAIVRDFVG